jgi:hypothetical protein
MTDSAVVPPSDAAGAGAAVRETEPAATGISSLTRSEDEWSICSYRKRYTVADSARWLHLDVAVKGPDPRPELSKEYYVESVITYDSVGRMPVRGEDLVDTVYIEAGQNTETFLLQATGIRYHSRAGGNPINASTRTVGPALGPLAGHWPCEGQVNGGR